MTTDLVRIPDETCVGGALGGLEPPNRRGHYLGTSVPSWKAVGLEQIRSSKLVFGLIPPNPMTSRVLDQTRGLSTAHLAAGGAPSRMRFQPRGGCTHRCGAYHDRCGAYHDHCGAHHDHRNHYHDRCGAYHDHCNHYHDRCGAYHH